MAIEIVDLPIEDGDFPVRYVSLPEGMSMLSQVFLADSRRVSHSHDYHIAFIMGYSGRHNFQI
jgi:hypothetical protein